jgi:hypothetical protein
MIAASVTGPRTARDGGQVYSLPEAENLDAFYVRPDDKADLNWAVGPALGRPHAAIRV